jgi:hypothetical protein
MRVLLLTVYYAVMIVFGSLLLTVGHMFLSYPKGVIPTMLFFIPFGYLVKTGHAKINVWMLALKVRGYK